MAALNAEMIYFMFESANMRRWNDHLRPMDLTEQDKQAHKAAIAWVIAKFEEDAGNKVDWDILIEHNLFAFISRMVLTDLKPQLYHRIVREKEEQVNEYVMSEFKRSVPNAGKEFFERLENYLKSPKTLPEDRIISAAHYWASRCEFELIKDMNDGRFKAEVTEKELDGKIAEHLEVQGVKKAVNDEGARGFINLVGQLRFQQRWAKTPRIPKTTVLGHSFMVANMVFLNDIDRGISGRQLYNDYYTALFHDLPEVLTKDVISPIKRNVNGLADLLESYEKELVESEIMPLLPSSWHREMEFLLYGPFEDTDDPVLGKRSGKTIKSCDLLAAYVEAHVSICYGVSSRSLKEGEEELRTRLMQDGGNIDAEELIIRLGRINV